MLFVIFQQWNLLVHADVIWPSIGLFLLVNDCKTGCKWENKLKLLFDNWKNVLKLPYLQKRFCTKRCYGKARRSKSKSLIICCSVAKKQKLSSTKVFDVQIARNIQHRNHKLDYIYRTDGLIQYLLQLASCTTLRHIQGPNICNITWGIWSNFHVTCTVAL